MSGWARWIKLGPVRSLGQRLAVEGGSIVVRGPVRRLRTVTASRHPG